VNNAIPLVAAPSRPRRDHRDLDRTTDGTPAPGTGALAATPYNSNGHALLCCAATIVRIIAESSTALAHARREDYEQRPQSVRAVPGQFARIHGVGNVDVVGGAELSYPLGVARWVSGAGKPQH
jgi:hypothetical protein